MARHTIRGTLPAGGSKQLILDDGLFTQGHRVVSIQIIGANNGDIGATAVLSRSSSAPPLFLFEDSNQIGWALWDADTTTGNRMVTVIDPDHVIQQELWIHGLTGGFNFLIELSPITLTEPQGVLQLVKAKRQG